MKKYQPTGNVTSLAVIVLTVCAVVAGVVLGLAMWAVEHFFNLHLIILFPAIAAFLLSMVISAVVRAMRVQNLPATIVSVFMGGIVLYGAYHYLGYAVTYRGDIVSGVRAELPDATDAEIDEFMNIYLQEAYGQTGFIGYLFDAAATGMTISRASSSSSSSGIELSGAGVWALWAAELLVTLFVAIGTPIKSARFPIDPKTGKHYPAPGLVAMADAAHAQSIFAALTNGNLQQIGHLFHKNGSQPYPRIEMFLARPSDPAVDFYAEFHHIAKKNFQQARSNAVRVERGMIARKTLKY
jgi:hypothetical protein